MSGCVVSPRIRRDRMVGWPGFEPGTNDLKRTLLYR